MTVSDSKPRPMPHSEPLWKILHPLPVKFMLPAGAYLWHTLYTRHTMSYTRYQHRFAAKFTATESRQLCS